MKKRILFGLVMIVALAALFYLDYRLERLVRPAPDQPARVGETLSRVLPALPLALLVLLLIVVAIEEMARLAQSAGMKLLTVSALAGSAMLGTLPYWWRMTRDWRPHGQDILPVLGFVVLVVFAEQMIRYRVEDAFRRVAVTLLTVLYLGAGSACILVLRIEYGLAVLLVFLLAVKFTDIGAYFTGMLAGRHKLIPWLSPGKTWEGLVGGIVFAMGVAIAWVWWIPMSLRGHPVQLWQAAVFAVVMALAGQFADLCESLLKRSAEMKDSGQLVPGFGGLLDILDSPLLAAPVALMLLRAVYG